MRYIKTYENIKGPEIGDYVVASTRFFSIRNSDFYNFLCNNVGKINDYQNDEWVVNYLSVPKPIRKYLSYWNRTVGWCRSFRPSEIEFYSKNKEDVEIYIQAKNYNL
jgi:hypothetical protein